jgi:hypothetical protein
MEKENRRLTSVWLEKSRNCPQLEGNVCRCVGVFMESVLNRGWYAESKHFADMPADFMIMTVFIIPLLTTLPQRPL